MVPASLDNPITFASWVRNCCPRQDWTASIVAETLNEELSPGAQFQMQDRQPRVATLAIVHRLYHAIYNQPKTSVVQRKRIVWALYQDLAPADALI